MKLALVVAMVLVGPYNYIHYTDGNVALIFRAEDRWCYANWEAETLGPCLPIPKELQ